MADPSGPSTGVAGPGAAHAPDRWRLLRHDAAPGAENMAIDEAIGRAVTDGLALPTLRFYAWAPPCVSLGRNQPFEALDVDACVARGYHIVRRPTGGRAILHTDELTYSVAAPAGHPLMAGMILDAYLRISHGLVEGLRCLGIAAEEAPGSNRAGPDVSAACFEVPSAYEILAGGRKLLGSAQSRTSKVVLQHGSLPLTGDLTRLIDCLAFAQPEQKEALRDSLAHHATTVEEITGRLVTMQEAAAAMVEGFQTALNIVLEPGVLMPEETAWAMDLVRQKYAGMEWTARR